MTDRFTDLSIDLETLGNRPGSVITQIGMAAFNADGTGPIFSDVAFIDPQSCLDVGMTVQWSTIRWWMQQSQAARDEFTGRTGEHLAQALTKLDVFINNFMRPNFTIWGYGANFDVTLLESAYVKCSRTWSWGYRQVLCARTLLASTPGIERPMPVREHFAEDDAVAQAKLVQLCLKGRL